jgi:hypothetical protein
MADLDWALANLDISPKDIKKIREAEKHTDFEGVSLNNPAGPFSQCMILDRPGRSGAFPS